MVASDRAGTGILLQVSWTRLRPIRTVSQVDLDFAVFTHEPFQYQRVRDEARAMRQLGMTFRAIAAALGVDDKAVRKALRSP